jgi:hypothetical protein
LFTFSARYQRSGAGLTALVAGAKRKQNARLRRPGATLLEVLVAIFVMGIGLLALLTLFPIGALRMAQAIQSESCAVTGQNAASVALMKGVASDPSLFFGGDPYLNPNNLGVAANASTTWPLTPSYPVYIDPIGFRASLTTTVAGASFLARRSVSFVDPPTPNPTQAALQWFTDQSAIDWENATPGSANSPPGTPRLLLPVPPNNPAFTRDVRYSYAFLVQRPVYTDATVVDTTIVVYAARPTAMTGNLTLKEQYFNTANYNTVNNTIMIDYSAAGSAAPTVVVGDWLLDNTPVLVNNVGGTTNQWAHGYFYRITSVTDLGNSQIEYEVEQPIRGFPAGAAVNAGVVITLDGVAEVYTKGVTR